MERQEPYIGAGSAPPAREERPKGRPAAWILIVVVALGAAGAAYWFWSRASAPPPPPERASVPTAPPPPLVQGPQHPIASEPPEQPLPPLKESDGPVAAALSALVGREDFGRIFLTENLVHNIVATIDNLPRDTVARTVSPLQTVPGLPVTSGKDAALVLAPANSTRYALHMKLVESVPTDRIVAFYRRHYPLFQQAYVDLGYPNGYFNDRLIEVIDHLLDTPDPAGPIRLKQPKVLFEFADPALEELSAGQKAMLRIGKTNRDKVKAKLREIRAAVAAAP